MRADIENTCILATESERFRRVEALFKASNITTETTKYTHLISALDEKYATVIDDLLDDPENDGKYTTIKEALMQRISDSDSPRVQKLLAPIQMGDQTPSQLLRTMRTIASDFKVADDLLKTLWLNRLPSDTQRMLETVSDDRDLKDLAETADRIHNVAPSGGNEDATEQQQNERIGNEPTPPATSTNQNQKFHTRSGRNLRRKILILRIAAKICESMVQH
ncbi:hypothetical protein TSAR_011011 [Trichomalopsis sarcophagae]|uniref:DUF7041 domain-containing protein n=1 Tax=Trichomalopsis sarcophagae TaxID=543379 RepID=A0A232EFJ7_9HYME|nr:hypothetical protein TSAR_011011 [Trichomalopsis sarcophagae]